MKEDDSLVISAEYIPETEEIEFSMKNSSEGLSHEDLENLFNPKFIAKRFGSGLGLSISKIIAENHGGRIDVESTSGHGTTFQVIIPLKR